jgi:hypothetical protein
MSVAAISQLLQASWTLSSPSKTDITWTDTKPETVDGINSALGINNYLIGCYNSTGPVSAEPLSREVWQKTEQVTVDIIVKVGTNTPEVTNSTRDAMAGEVYRIIHSGQFMISGISAAYISKETFKVESTELSRLALQVSCVSFNVAS